jgi:DNA-binding NarL/FixJ family response regulator
MMVKQLLRLGVQGILQKGISAREVLSACQRVMRGCLCLDLAEGDMAELSSAPLAENRPGLTSRETEILDLVARGKRSKEIAAVLGISVRTVDKHRENVMRKLGVHDVAGLVRYAAAQGLFRAGAGI